MVIIFPDLKGKVACFPSPKGAAFYSVMNILQESRHIKSNCSSHVKDYFSSKSSYGLDKSSYKGDGGAMECLNSIGDVAFIGMESIKNLTGKYHSFFNVEINQ